MEKSKSDMDESIEGIPYLGENLKEEICEKEINYEF